MGWHGQNLVHARTALALAIAGIRQAGELGTFYVCMERVAAAASIMHSESQLIGRRDRASATK
jgi:hypothetical protein